MGDGLLGEPNLPVGPSPRARGRPPPACRGVGADAPPRAPPRRIVVLDRILLPPFPDGPHLTASFLAEAVPVPSDRSGLHGESRYLTRCSKSTLLGTDGGPCCSPERSRTAPIASELVDPGGELVSVEPKILPELHMRNAVRPRTLVEPAHRHSQEIRGFLHCQPGHRARSVSSPRSGAVVSCNQ